MDNNEQPIGYIFEVKGTLVKEHECPICLHLIRNAIELPCSHLMCMDCLIYYEGKEQEKHENADFKCSICQELYCRNEKKEVRSLDRIIRESLKVKCKNRKDGCDWVGSISNYQNHHINVCDYLMVECPSNGCKEQMQRRAIDRHQDSCKYRIVSCGYCEGRFPICWLEDHHETCPSYPVTCQNPDCKDMIQRKQIDAHLKNECQHQVVSCLYGEIGCTVRLPRHLMTNHHQEAMQHHSFLLLKSHVELSKKNKELENQLNKSNDTLEELQRTVTKQEEYIESQQAEIISLKDDLKKHQELKMKEKLTNLETFAKESADFFKLVSYNHFFSFPMIKTLSQKAYDDGNIEIFKNQLKEMKDKQTDCYYLQTLGKAVEVCHKMFMSEAYDERFSVTAQKMLKYVFYRSGPLSRLKIDLFPCKSISFKLYNNGLLFHKEVIRKGKWNVHNCCFASYYEKTEDCYYVALSSGDVKEVWLLHHSDEKQKKKLMINDKTLIEFDEYDAIASFILEMQVDRRNEKTNFLF